MYFNRNCVILKIMIKPKMVESYFNQVSYKHNNEIFEMGEFKTKRC